MSRKLRAIKRELKRRMHEDERETGQWLGEVLNGWLNYYAAPTSYHHLRRFRHYLQWLWLRALRRRSQKDSFEWKRLRALSEQLWPRTRILHPWPDQRFAVRHGYPSRHSR